MHTMNESADAAVGLHTAVVKNSARWNIHSATMYTTHCNVIICRSSLDSHPLLPNIKCFGSSPTCVSTSCMPNIACTPRTIPNMHARSAIRPNPLSLLNWGWLTHRSKAIMDWMEDKWSPSKERRWMCDITPCVLPPEVIFYSCMDLMSNPDKKDSWRCEFGVCIFLGRIRFPRSLRREYRTYVYDTTP